MKVLITGASGHLGSASVRECLAQGHQVVALVRQESDLRGLEGSNAKIAYGDVLDRDSVLAAAQGCNAIIHHAAVYRLDLDKPEDIIRPAVDGTKNVLEVAQRVGIKRVVYTSSAIAIGMSPSSSIALSGSTWNEYASGMPYAEAKTNSERIAHDMARELGIELMVFCPTMIMGPGDYRITPSHGLVLGLLAGQVPAAEGGVSLVSVDDVAKLHVQALTQGVPFKRYAVSSGENFSNADFRHLLEQVMGHPLPTGPQAPADQPVYFAYYDISDTVQDFGFRPQAAIDVLKSVVEWLHSRKLIAA